MPNLAMHVVIFVFGIDNDTDITFWYRYQIDPYRDSPKHIVLGEPGTCDQEHLTSPTTIAKFQRKSLL